MIWQIVLISLGAPQANDLSPYACNLACRTVSGVPFCKQRNLGGRHGTSRSVMYSGARPLSALWVMSKILNSPHCLIESQ